MHRFARAFELTVSYFGISLLLLLIVATNTVPTSYAASASATTSSSSCVAPSFYSLTITPASLNTPWSLPLLSTLDGPYVPTVKATGLPPGVILDDQKTVLSAGGSTLHNWVLDGAPTQLGTYTITVTAQNSCGGASTVVTLPINNSNSGQGTALCPTGTMGTYPNCVSSTAATVSFDKSSLSATSTNPTITGTSNTSVVNLTARSSTGNMTSSGPETVSGGRWSAPLSNLMTGIYSLFLYDGSNTLLIPGSLVVMLPSGSASSGTSSPIPTAHVNVQSGVVIPNTTVVSNGSSCVSINSVLQLGSRGSDVFNLQNFLISRGLLAQGSATGYFGAQTRAAVQQFQVQQGIVSSGSESTTGFGLVGAHTRAVIEAACAQVSGATSESAKAAAVVPPAPLLVEQFRVFELAYGSGATMVLSAHTMATGEQEKFVTLIGQPDLYGGVVVLMKNVTDAAHLDLTPRMRLVDAVDAEADNRGELLFELRGATQRQFTLYRVLRGDARQIFLSGPQSFVVAAMN